MVVYKFSDIFSFQKKSHIKAGDGLSKGIYPFFTSSQNLTKRYNEAQFEGENLIFGTGGMPSVHFCNKPFSVSTDCLVAKPNKVLDSKFVYYFLFGKPWILANGFKGAGLKHISKSYISEIKIALPPLEEQKRIVRILDQADSLRQKRQKAISLLDDYLEAVFLEMFGDPVTNPKGWGKLTLQQITKKITDGTHQSPGFVENGIPFIFISNIIDNEISLDTKKFISENTYQELTKSTPIEINDILYTTVGSYGNPAIVKTAKKFCFQRHIAHIKPDNEKTNIYFLYGLLKSPYIKRQADERAKGVAQKTLNLGELKFFDVILPPMSIQKEYADIIAKTEKLKSSMTSQAVEMENNFNALMQGAFAK